MWADPQGHTLTYSHDVNGRLDRVTDDMGLRYLDLDYDGQGRVQGVADSRPGLLSSSAARLSPPLVSARWPDSARDLLSCHWRIGEAFLLRTLGTREIDRRKQIAEATAGFARSAVVGHQSSAVSRARDGGVCRLKTVDCRLKADCCSQRGDGGICPRGAASLQHPASRPSLQSRLKDSRLPQIADPWVLSAGCCVLFRRGDGGICPPGGPIRLGAFSRVADGPGGVPFADRGTRE